MSCELNVIEKIESNVQIKSRKKIPIVFKINYVKL